MSPMDPRPLKYVAPTGTADDSAFAPEPVTIYDLPSGGGAVTSDDITDATTVGKNVLTATDAAAARTAIGAGTSNLAIGTTGTTAAAGNHTQAATTVNVAADATNGISAGTLQVVISDLAARVKALEDAAG